MRRTLLVLAAIAILSAGASARECNGVSFPDQIQVDGSSLTLNGLGLRKATMLKVKVYVAGLYVLKPSTDADALLRSSGPREVILQFVRDVDAKDMQNAFDESFAKNSGGQLPALRERIAKLKGWMADMKTGQRLTFVQKSGVGTEVNVNGTVKGTIPGDDFSNALLANWLGRAPANPEIKAGLLGGVCD